MRSYVFASVAYLCCCVVPGFSAAQEIDLIGESSSAWVSDNSQATTEQIPLATEYSSYPQGNVVYQQSAPVSYGGSNAIALVPQYSSPSSVNFGTNSGVNANTIPSSTYARSSAPQYSTSQMTYTSAAPISSSVPTTSYSSSSPSYSSSASSSGSCQPGLAQSKAVQAAQMGLRGHLGSGLGGARYEGVGWSNQSAQQAIEHCCYWGQRPTAQIGVTKGSDGLWYACVLYY